MIGCLLCLIVQCTSVEEETTDISIRQRSDQVFTISNKEDFQVAFVNNTHGIAYACLKINNQVFVLHKSTSPLSA